MGIKKVIKWLRSHSGLWYLPAAPVLASYPKYNARHDHGFITYNNTTSPYESAYINTCITLPALHLFKILDTS